MLGVAFLLSLYFSAHAFDVEYWTGNQDHTKLIEELEKHDIKVTTVEKQSSLLDNGEWRKDGLIVQLDSFEENEILDFVNSGRSLVVFLTEGSETADSFLPELGVMADSDYHDALKCTYNSPTQDRSESQITCGGYSLTLDKPAHAEYYNISVAEDKSVYCVAVQGKNDARIVIFGGEMFGSDDTADEDSKGFDAALDLVLWAFRKSGVMRARDLRYVRLADGTVNPPELTISDDITFSIVLETYDDVKSKWVPWDSDDVQVDFTMLVPRLRKTVPSLHNGTFSRTFKLPDIFGVYQFILDYHARGYTPINVTHQLMVHPRRHDEQPRYVKGAYPFYAASLIMAIAVVILCVLIARSAPIFLDLPSQQPTQDKPATKETMSKKKSE